MSPTEAFKIGGQNPNNGLWVHDWHVVGCTFSPIPVEHKGKIILGFRTLTVMDVASYFMMHVDHIPEDPSPVTFEQIKHVLEGTFTKYQKPQAGFVVSHSTWQSSHELLLDENTSAQGEFLRKNGIDFAPMSQAEKVKISDWGKSLGLAIEFNADNINQYS